MEITTEQIKHLATLSRLEFSDEELEKFKIEFQSIVDYVNQLSKVDTSNAVDKSQKITIDNLREDVAGDSLSNEDVVGNSKNNAMGAFVVPTVVEE